MIGFDKLLYFVEESEGEVVVIVGVQSGTLSGEVVIQLTTISDTATGSYNQVLLTPLPLSRALPFSLALIFFALYLKLSYFLILTRFLCFNFLLSSLFLSFNYAFYQVLCQ